MEKTLEGNLAAFEVPDLLTFIGLGGRTGVLVLERPEQETKLFFREGKAVFATSTAEDLRFGNTLVRLGKLSAQTVERVMQKQRAGARIGQILLSEKILTEEALASFLKIQVSEVIFHTFSWREGTFTFYDKTPPPATAVTLEMDLQNLIMEGVRRGNDLDRMAAAFPDREMVVEALVNPERVKQSVNLLPDEWRVLFLVDGRRSVGEVCHLVGNPDEMATLQILQHLRAARFLALGPPRPEPAPVLAPPIPVVEGGGTQKWIDGGPPPAVVGPSVEFSSGVPARKVEEDDTKEIVSKQAARYLANATRLTVSRLVQVKDGVETSFPLIKDSYTLGRHRNNDIVITDPKASSFHARIDRSPDGFAIVDLQSRNGCWVNGKRVETALLKTGDDVRLGMARLIYKVDYTSAV
ncbi:MAG TPA: DUF4388 domain-containing protein [Vicinamibacteria bacterium]|nr:DUF4388 domain-containing protein [Vicinamibacteria bacterium]